MKYCAFEVNRNRSEISISWIAFVTVLPGLVPQSARFVYPGTEITYETTFVENSNRAELTSLRIERSEANRQVESVVKGSFESTAIQWSILELSTSLNALTKTCLSSISSPAAKVSAEASNFTGRCDLRELHEIM